MIEFVVRLGPVLQWEWSRAAGVLFEVVANQVQECRLQVLSKRARLRTSLGEIPSQEPKSELLEKVRRDFLLMDTSQQVVADGPVITIEESRPILAVGQIWPPLSTLDVGPDRRDLAQERD